MRKLTKIVADQKGASAAEFALVLPLLLIFLLGLIDTGRFMWEYNRAEKATQMGVRYAVATDLVPAGLATYGFAVDGGIPAGTAVPKSSFEYAICNEDDCAQCAGSMCPAIGYDGAAFANIVARMAAMYPAIQDENVVIEYRNVGLGYSGAPDLEDPVNPSTIIYSPDVAPLVTVRLTGMSFSPITFLLSGGQIAMPDFRAGLTLEDGSGDVSN